MNGLLGCRHAIPPRLSARLFHSTARKAVLCRPRASSAQKTAQGISGDGALQQRSNEQQALYVKDSVHAGQKVHGTGTVIIYGDVEKGAELSAGADVIVIGRCGGAWNTKQMHAGCMPLCHKWKLCRLAGTVHAGSNGSGSALVLALGMQPEALQIGDAGESAALMSQHLPDLPWLALYTRTCALHGPLTPQAAAFVRRHTCGRNNSARANSGLH